jgi:hypothetical protein
MLPQRFQGMASTFGYGGRVYRNRLIDLSYGGPYHDQGPDVTTQGKARDCTMSGNYYYFVWVGPFSNVQNREPTLHDQQLWNIASENIIELQPFPEGNWNWSPPAGIAFWGPFAVGATCFPAARVCLIRDNVMRWAGGVSSSGYYGSNQYGISVTSAESLIIEDNLIFFVPQAVNPISYSQIQNPVRKNNNTGPNGTDL